MFQPERPMRRNKRKARPAVESKRASVKKDTASVSLRAPAAQEMPRSTQNILIFLGVLSAFGTFLTYLKWVSS